MKKILPINPNPYIRTYTHHGYHNAIISSPDKVSVGSHKVAQVKVSNYNNYTWNVQNDDLQYKVDNDNNFIFFSNKWDINMNAAFWRPCNNFDEIEISIHHQMNTNVWASITVFLTDNSRDVMTNIDSSYVIQCGNFSKDGLYYRVNADPHVKILSTPSLPLNIRLLKMGERIAVQYYNSKMTKKEILIIDAITQYPLKRIGFAVDLGCNNYYEWLFSNYINFYVNTNHSMPIDYLCNVHKDWTLHTNNYFLDFITETEDEINSLGFSLLEYIKKMINLNRYIEILVNDNLHLGGTDSNGAHFHQNLIYGYDDELQQFHLLYYKNGIIKSTAMTYKDFLSERNYIADRKIYIIKYNPGYEAFKLDPKHVLQLLQEYRDSNNISHYEPLYTSQYHFGISGLQYLIEHDTDSILIKDVRIGYMIYEHSICTRDRIEYFFYKNILSGDEYVQLYNMALEECELTSITKNLIIKQHLQKNYDTIKVRAKIIEILEMEKNLINQMIEILCKL